MAYDDPGTVCAPWASVDDLCRCTDATSVDCETGAEVAASYPFTDEQLLEAASNILFARSCYRWPGACSRTIHPCPSCVCSANPCRCGGQYYVLPLATHYPILSVTEVRINGVAFDPAKYRVDDYTRLVRLDGEAWPLCNNLGIEDSCDEQIEVDYTYGVEPPIEGRMAAAELACMLKQACMGGPCDLPGALGEHIRSLTRRGVSVEVDDITSLNANALIRGGLTGNQVVDFFLTTHGECGSTRFIDPVKRARGVQVDT